MLIVECPYNTLYQLFTTNLRKTFRRYKPNLLLRNTALHEELLELAVTRKFGLNTTETDFDIGQMYLIALLWICETLGVPEKVEKEIQQKLVTLHNHSLDSLVVKLTFFSILHPKSLTSLLLTTEQYRRKCNSYTSRISLIRKDAYNLEIVVSEENEKAIKSLLRCYINPMM
jgi:hypothetical protein